MAPLGNPNYPCVAGGEILPVASVRLPVDQGTRYDFEHDVRASSAGTTEGQARAGFASTQARQLHTVAFELYRAGDELVNDTVTTVVLPLRRVDLGADAVIVGGGTALEALSAGGGGYVEMDSTLTDARVSMWFDPGVLTTGTTSDWPRVVRVGIRFLAWKDDSALATPGEGFGAVQQDSVLATNRQYGSWLVAEYQRNARYVTRWFGETNFLPRDVNEEWRMMPFAVTDLSHMDSGDESLWWDLIPRPGYDSSQTTTFLDHVQMVVEVAEERRTGVGSRIVTNLVNDPGAGLDFGYDSSHFIEWRDPHDTESIIAMDAGRYVMTMREALPASPSDRYRAATTGAYQWSRPEAIGPSLQVLAISQALATQAPQLETRIGTISGGVLVGPTEPFEDFNIAAVAYDEATRLTEHPFWAAYTGLLTNADIRLTYAANIVQPFTADGTTTYTRVKVMVRPDPLTVEDLKIYVMQPLGTPLVVATLTAADARALPDVGGGWRIAEVAFNAPYTPAAGPAYIVAYLATAEAVWFVSGADLLGNALYATAFDHAMVVVCEPDVPPAPTVTEGENPVVTSAACGITAVRHYHLEWTVDPDATLYAVQRTLDGVVYRTLAYLLVADAVAGVLAFDDLGAPWDVPMGYQLVAYRASDLLATTGPLAVVFGIPSGGAVLGLSSATATMIYAPTTESGGVSTSWQDLSPVEYVQLAGEDASRALRAPENRGLGMTVPVLIADLAACTAGVPNPLTVGQRSLEPSAWDLVRTLAREERLDVRFPGGHTRVMSLALTGLVARNTHGVYLAELVLTDVHAELENPLDGV